jgi:enhancing lycopene biosynthesis protein 2
MAKIIGVILSGCGNRDGSEIHEAVFTLLSFDRAGAEALCMAPDIPQAQVINFLTGKVMESERRNALLESARIARGKIKDIKTVHSDDIDALIIPGGSGAASTLSDFNAKGEQCHVQPEVARLIRETLTARKPIGVICIAPVIMAKMGQETGRNIKLTIGNDPETAKTLERMGVEHVDTPPTGMVVDKKNRVVSTPAYMMAKRISETAEGIEKLVNEVIKMA